MKGRDGGSAGYGADMLGGDRLGDVHRVPRSLFLFKLIVRGHLAAGWKSLEDGRHQGVCSCVSCTSLTRFGHRGEGKEVNAPRAFDITTPHRSGYLNVFL